MPLPRARRLRLLVLAVADRCDQRCVHCQIWQGTGARALTLAERLRVVEEALAGGASEALLTGGEPLLSSDLWPIAERLRGGGARLMLATNGMLLARYAADVARLFAEVYVSLDGPSAAVHDAQRGVPAWDRVAAGVRALRELPGRPLVVARSVLHAGTIDAFAETIAAARSLGVDHVSFLPLDAASDAFGAQPPARTALVPTGAQVDRFEAAVRALGAPGDGFVSERPEKLLGVARHLRASGGSAPFERPPCDAPWWSSVVEADGSVRPCFFQPAVGDAREGLRAVRRGPAYRRALRQIRRPNDACARCVCPKRRGGFLGVSA
jgi:MoaA/NifB/PqqE/SkfB family radical SAM enzyme